MNIMKFRSGHALLAGLLFVLTLAACASTGATLQTKQIDASTLMNSAPGREAYNTIRFATYGPQAQQLYGYFLYKDGIQVASEQGIPFERLGKMTLHQVMADYQRVQKEKMYTAGSSLNVQEYTRQGAVVGYTAVDLNIDVNIWDITQEGGPPMLRIVYKDLRQEREQQREMERPRRGMY